MPSPNPFRRLLRRLFKPSVAESKPLAEIEVVLDGASAVAVTEACIAEAAGLSASVPVDDLARTFATERPVNMLGQAVHRVGAADARGAVATALGLSMSGMRSTAFCSGPELGGAQDQLVLAASRHLPLVAHLTCRGAAGPGNALGSGHESYHGVADSGLIQLFASNAQEAVDFTMVARRVAEATLVPVLVAMDGEQTAGSIQNVKVPSAKFVKVYMGSADDVISTPTPSQSLIFGSYRRRVPRWFDLDRPMLNGAMLDGSSWALGAAGQRAFFTDHVAEALTQAFDDLGRSAGRNYENLFVAAPSAPVMVVAQGSAVETARAISAHLGGRVGVVGVRCLRPFPGAQLAKLLGGKEAVFVLDRVDTPLATDAPLLRELRAAMQRALANGRDSERNPGYPCWQNSEQPRVSSLLYGLGGAPLAAADLAAALGAGEKVGSPLYLGVDFVSPTSRPKRQVLVDSLRRSYPDLGKLAAPRAAAAVDVRAPGSATVAVHRVAGEGADEVAAIAVAALHGVIKGQLRGRSDLSWDAAGSTRVDLVTYAPDELYDPGDGIPVDVAVLANLPASLDLGPVADGGAVLVDSGFAGSELWERIPVAVQRVIGERKLVLYRSQPGLDESPAFRAERLAGALLGVLAAQGKVEVKARRLASARGTLLHGVELEERDARAEALAAGFESVGAEDVSKLTPSKAAAGDISVPFAVSHLKAVDGADAPADSLPRFWNQVGAYYRDGARAELSSDPYFTAGVVPPLSSAFCDQSDARTIMPAFDASKCTGCAKCWTVCPDTAIGPVVIGAKELIETGMKLAKEGGAQAEPLRMMVAKLAPKTNKYLKTADPVPASAGEILDAACSGMLEKAPLPDDRKQAINAAFKATMNAVGRLPIARTNPFFYDREREAAGSGELLALAINADSCKGCQACIKACEPEALTAQPSTAEAVARTRRMWALWQKLPDTSGATIAKASEHPDVGELPALLLSRHCLLTMAGGDGAEAGSGAKVALRLSLAAAEGYLQKQLQEHANQVRDQRDQVEAGIRDNLSAALPSGDLDALARGLEQVDDSVAPTLSDLVAEVSKVSEAKHVNAVGLQRLVGIAKELGELHKQLTEGEFGLGRARLGMVLAPDDLLRGIGSYPYNPFQVPVVIDASGQAASLARGALEGQLGAVAVGFGLLRRAALELSNATEANFAEAELKRLTFADFTAAERKLCPPLLLVGTSGAFTDRALAQVLDSELPAKLLLLSDGGDGLVRSGASIDRSNLGVLGLALGSRKAFVAQSSISAPAHLAAAMRRALAHDGPAVLHIHAPCPELHGFARDAASAQAALAVATRTFPLYIFDPAAEGVFGSGLELDGNPDIDKPWGEVDGNPLTPVDWARSERRFAAHFGAEVSAEVQAMADQRARDWQVLQELAGVATPFTARVRVEAEAAVAAAHEQDLAAVRSEYEARISSLRDEYRAEMAVRIKERLLALAGAAPLVPTGNGEQAKQS